jgi:hypothetical protein
MPPHRPIPRALIAALLLWIALATAVVAAAEPSPAPDDDWHHTDGAGQPVVDLWFGWSSTCPHCTKARAWLTEWAPTAPWLEVHSLQVDGPDADASIETLVGLAAGIGETVDGVPAFLFAGRLATGFDEAATTGAALEAALTAYHASLGAVLPPPSPDASDDPGTSITVPVIGSLDAASVSLPALAVLLGSLDAINPCALSILLFLMSALIGARSRRRILLVGGTFIAATGVVYFVLMAAWLNAFLWFGELRVVTVLAGAAAVVVGAINIKDFGWFRRGPSLVIPASARPAIFGRMLDLSESVALPAMLGATILVAATASAYEMLCTGGFPVVFTRVLTLADLPTPVYYGYVALYVTVYVIPMLVIVGVAAMTLGGHGVSIDAARRLKLLSGLLMVGLGSMLLVAPDRLSDLGWTLGLFATAMVVWLALVVIDRGHRTPSLAHARK